MKTPGELAEEAFWACHPVGALMIIKESWISGRLSGFEAGLERAKELADFHCCEILSDAIRAEKERLK